MAAASFDDNYAAYPVASRRPDPTQPDRTMEEALTHLSREAMRRSKGIAHADLGSDELNRARRPLSHRLDPQNAEAYAEFRPTLACPIGQWRYLANFVASASPLIEQCPDARFVTINPRGYSLTPEELIEFQPARFHRALRADLDRVIGEADARGWLLGGIHGEYRSDIGRFHLHHHGIGSGGVLQAIEGLRGQGKYKPDKRTPDNPDGMRRRIWIRDDPVQLPGALTYCAQSFWPCRWAGELEPGKLIRSTQDTRIPEPAHSIWLLWMHQQRFSDLTIRYRCCLGDGQLKAR